MRGRVKYLAGLIALGSTRPRKRLHNRLDPSRQQIALRRVAGERLMLAHHPVSPSRGMPASQGPGCYGSHLAGFVLRLSPAAATPSVPPLVPAGRGRRFAQSRLSLGPRSASLRIEPLGSVEASGLWWEGCVRYGAKILACLQTGIQRRVRIAAGGEPICEASLLYCPCNAFLQARSSLGSLRVIVRPSKAAGRDRPRRW